MVLDALLHLAIGVTAGLLFVCVLNICMAPYFDDEEPADGEDGQLKP